MTTKRFGDFKGPLAVWALTISYFTLVLMFSSSSSGTLPQNISVPIVLAMLYGLLQPYGVIFVFLLFFVAIYEKRRLLRDVFASVGLRKSGVAKSVFWTLALIPLFLIVYVLLMVVSYLFGPVSFPQTGSGQVPPWYLGYMVFYSFFPVAVVEEAFARGYLLDRLMPEHPSSVRNSFPAMLLSSLLFTLYHVPGYLGVYMFSPTYATALLGLDVFPISVILSMAYVKAGTRNVAGPVLLHFLADSFPVIVKLVLG